MNHLKCTRVLVCLISAAAVVSAATAPPPSKAAAARFLEQASFGPTPAAIAEVQSLGFAGWIDKQFLVAASPIPDPSVDAKGNYSLRPVQDSFFHNAVSGQDQLRQRMAFALSEIFVVSGVKLSPQAITPYLRILQNDAFTTYDKILYNVTLSPAMGHYLDMVNNNKGLSPNENYAREVLQLFSLGLVKLDKWGRPVDKNGTPVSQSHLPTVPTYTQDMIEGFSATFTGWTYAPIGTAVSHFGNPQNWDAPMVAFEKNHDMNPKVLLDKTTLAGQTAEQDLATALAEIFNNSNVPPFICRQLIQRFVTSNPSDNYVRRIVNVFESHPRGDMKAVVKAILTDSEARAYDDGVTSVNDIMKLREPLLWINGLMRGLNATVAASNNLVSYASNLGQNVYYSPTVFNYFPPNYQVTINNRQVNAPEFDLLSEATSMGAADFANTVAFGSISGVTIDYTPYITALGTAPTTATINALIDSLNTALLIGKAMPKPIHDAIFTVLTTPKMTPKAIVQNAVYLIASSSNFKVAQ